MIGQYVMYYNERLPGSTYPAGYSQHAQFAVCEIEVYGKFHFNYFKQELFLFFSVLKFFFLNSLHVKMTQSLQFNQKLCLCFLRVLSNIDKYKYVKAAFIIQILCFQMSNWLRLVD